MTERPRPRIAVLLAAYRGEAHIAAQVTSILWQRDASVHLFVRDDGSPDGTIAAIDALIRDHPDRITLVDGDGVRTGSATGNFFRLLAGVELSAFDYVALADQDDVWTPDKLRRAVRTMQAERAEAYSSDLIAYDLRGNRSWVLRKAGTGADLDYLFQGASAGCTYVLSRRAAETAAEVVRAMPALPVAASHDWILYAICRSRGIGWARDAGAEILYRQHGANDYGARPGLRGLFSKFRMARSDWYRAHVLWMRNVVVGTPAEREVLEAVERGRMSDRLRLARRAGEFRRTRRDVALLRAALVGGMI